MAGRILIVRPMKSRAHYVLLGSLCLVALCLAGCANIRYSVFGCISARAELGQASLLYNVVTIEPPTNKPAPPFCLRFPDGQVVQLSALTSKIVKNAGYTNIVFDFRTQDSHNLSVYGNGASFRFFNEMPVWIYLTTGAVGISREDAKRFYTLPMKQDELEQLFGHPDKINNGHEW
jgi:hypothetical protein